jgi:hypothetical protein
MGFNLHKNILMLDNSDASKNNNDHRVQHYWLCEDCSHHLTLVSTAAQQVLLKAR